MNSGTIFGKSPTTCIIIFIVESFPYLNNFLESKLISRCTLWKHSWYLNRERFLFNPTKNRLDSLSTKLNLFNLNYLQSYFEKLRAENWTRLLKQLCIAKCEISLTRKHKQKNSAKKNILQIYCGASYLLRFILRHAAYQFEEQLMFYFLIFLARKFQRW